MVFCIKKKQIALYLDKSPEKDCKIKETIKSFENG